MASELLNEFKDAAKQIASDLRIDSEITYDLDDSELGIDFSANATEDPKEFDFWLHEEKEKDGSTWKASLSIGYREGAAQFYFQENIDYIFGHSSFLCRWAAWAVSNFNKKHNPVDLESIFNESTIRVYGFPGYSEPGEAELKILSNGILNLQKSKVLIYKFRHVDPPSGYLIRSFSYAIWVTIPDSHCFWVFFPDLSSLDSGRAYRTYKLVDKLLEMLNTKLEVEIHPIDIDYELLETFLASHEETFSSSIFKEEADMDDTDFFDNEPPVIIENGLSIPFENIKRRFQNREYPEALRNLRALVQQAEEDLAKAKGLDYSEIKEPTINKLASFLCEKKVIDGQLIPWFNAFTSLANPAAHKIFPTKEYMSISVNKKRIILTFRIGCHLLDELSV
jgi:hypothetical protein